VNPEEIRTLLIDRAEAIDATRPERLDDLFGRIRRHQRRRTAAAVAAASCLVLAVVVGAALLTRGPAHVTNPVPPATSAPADPTPQAPVRKVTYADGYWPTTTIHYGDRRVDIRKLVAAAGRKGGIPGVVHMDVTDSGVVFTTNDGKIWFTDGSAIHQIGKAEGYLSIRDAAFVVSGTAGSRVAWIAGSGQHAEIVVYDTKTDREVARVPVPDCTTLVRYRAGKPYPSCELTSLVNDDHVYFTLEDGNHLLPDVPMRLDVPTGTLERATADELAADLASSPRGLIVGDSPETGVVSDGYGVAFAVKGARLVAKRDNSRTTAFDARTRKQLQLRLPFGYHGASEFTAFEWLDDDRLALMDAANSFHQTTREIVVCRISTGRCDVAVPAGDVARIAPHLGLPG
jgi:hypothetical protein